MAETAAPNPNSVVDVTPPPALGGLVVPKDEDVKAIYYFTGVSGAVLLGDLRKKVESNKWYVFTTPDKPGVTYFYRVIDNSSSGNFAISLGGNSGNLA